MPNIFDQFDTPDAGTQSTNIFDQFDTPEKPETWGEYGKGLLQKVGQGATLGYGDEIAAGAGAVGNKAMRAVGIDVPEKNYSDILNEVRGEEKQFTERHPYQALGAEVAGGLSSLAAGPVRAAVAAPTWIGRVFNSAKVGAKYGAISGFGNSEGGVENRLLGTGKGFIGGGIAGPLLSDVALPVVSRAASVVPQTVRFAEKAMQSARDPEGAAFRNVADKGVQSGLDFNAMRARVSPQTSANLQARGISEEDIATLVSRGLKGEDPAIIGQDYGIAGTTVRDYVKRYQDANPTPLNMIDVAKDVAGEGGAGPMTRYARATHSIAGGEDGAAAQALMSRQEMQPGRVSGIIEKRMGGGDFEAKKAANADLLQKESKKAYDAFYQEPELATSHLDDLMEDPLFRKAVDQAQQHGTVEQIGRNQKLAKKGQPEEPVPYADKRDPKLKSLHQELRDTKDALTEARRRRQDATSKEDKRAALDEIRTNEDAITSINREVEDLTKGNPQVFSPELLDHIQRQLRIAGEGFSNPNDARHAQTLREVFLDRVEQHYPDFKKIRTTYASGRMEQDAFDAGVRLTTKLGQNTREALSGYDGMTPAQKNIFRDSFGTALQDKAANGVRGAQAASQFTSDSFQQIVEKLYPKSDKKLFAEGQKLLRELRMEATTTRTKNDVLAGSRTAELSSDMEKAGTAGEAAAQAFTGNWMGVLRTLGKRLSQQIGTEGSKQSLKILTETDPAKLLPILTRLAREAQTSGERQAYVASIRELRASGFAGANRAIGGQSGKQSAVKPKEITITPPSSWDQFPRNRLLGR